MINPDDAVKRIPQELDSSNWVMEYDQTDIQVYSKSEASDSPVIGFRTVTTHFLPLITVFEFLKDVCGAMNKINHMFVKGEEFRDWSSELDPNGKVVRTSFRMPFPMTNREFLHGLHSHQLDETTGIVAYTPLEDNSIPVQKGYVRCPMYISGQRITKLESGALQVEFLMVYELGGKISTSVQDKWLKKSHVGAYIKEWRKLREYMFPPTFEEIDYPALTSLMKHSLEQNMHWQFRGKPKAGQVQIGRVPFCARNAVRTEITVQASLETVVDVIADQSLAFLPQWNKEFLSGDVLKVIEQTTTKKSWLIRVHYKTPFFLSNREYIYFFSREWLNQDECIIYYHSINHDSKVPTGFVRAVLYPSVHRCTRKRNGSTVVEHLLITDLKGKLGSKQDRLLKTSLVKARCRDMKNQDQLFKKLFK